MSLIIPKSQMTEEDIKLQFITPALQAKWPLNLITMETKITDGRINLQGNKVSREKAKKADYILYINAGKGFCIGHSYFCGQDTCTDEWLDSIVNYDILPMLSEYWFDDTVKLQRWENILRGVLQ